MAKNHKRSNRETRKPKQPKKQPVVADADPVRIALAARRPPGREKS